MYLHHVTPFGIIHPIETGQLANMYKREGMVRKQAIIIERSSVLRRLSPILLLGSLIFDALVGGGEIAFFI
jgi:hypothetical protein